MNTRFTNLVALGLLLTGAAACAAPDDGDVIAGDESNVEQGKGTKASAILEGVEKVVYRSMGNDPVTFDADSPFSASKLLEAAIDPEEILDPNPAMTRCMSTHGLDLQDAKGELLASISYTCGGEPADGLTAVVRRDGKFFGVTLAAKKIDDLANAQKKVGTPCPAADLSTLLCTASGLLTCGMGEWRASACSEATACSAESFDDMGSCKPR